jgi:site-specific DNA recombinase
MTTRTAIYTRISKDQSGERLGVTRQLDECLKLADRLGWQVVAHYDDNDISAFSRRTKRPGYEALLDAMKNREVDAILCWHTDRLYRRPGDLERLIEVTEACGVDIRTVQSGTIDLSNSAGRLVARILGSMSNAESETKGERQRAANVQKAQQGRWQTANRTFGYTMDGQPLEPEASAVRQAVVDVLAGHSIQGVARAWNAAGFRTTLAGTVRTDPRTKVKRTVSGLWTSPKVRRLLMNPRYAGLKVHQGRIIGPGDWSPLIDPDTHKGLVALLSDPVRKPRASFERRFMGAGLYRCGICESTMRTAYPGARKSRCYACRNGAHLVRSGQPLDDYVTATVLERLSRDDAANLLANQGVDVVALGVQREALQRKLDDITRMFDDDEIDAEQFRTTSVSTRNKLAVIDRQLAEVGRSSPAAALAAADDVWALWNSMTPTQQADAVDEIAVVTVNPCPKGQRRFDPDYIDIVWKQPE